MFSVSHLSRYCFFSHRPRDEGPHLFRRFFLHLIGGVGVGVQGEACTEVAQHTGYRFHIHAVLPTTAAVILVAISVVLTMIAGLIPSRMAAKKDPVIALRTE